MVKFLKFLKSLMDMDMQWSVILLAWLVGVCVGYTIASVIPFLRARMVAKECGYTMDATVSPLMDKKPHKESYQTWIVSTKDLAFFQRHLGEGKDGDAATAHTGGPWEKMMQKEIPGLVRYIAWRRSLRNGSTEYKSITLTGGVTAKEFMDFYLDDEYRPRWDTMLHHTSLLENVDPLQRKQVTLWRRNFPFNFISEREYVIARCLFREGDDLFAVTKSVGEDYEHPALAVQDSDHKTVRIDSYYSMWRSRNVCNPWDASTPACETVLLHHDDLMVPEHLARLTIKLGMWGFVKNIAQQVHPFVQERRQRCGMYEDDPQAFGMQLRQIQDATEAHTPNTVLLQPTTPATNTSPSSLSIGSNTLVPDSTPHTTHPPRAWSLSRRSGSLSGSLARQTGSKHSGKAQSDSWAKGLVRVGWTVVVLTVVRLLMLNSSAGSHPELGSQTDVRDVAAGVHQGGGHWRSDDEKERGRADKEAMRGQGNTRSYELDSSAYDDDSEEFGLRHPDVGAGSRVHRRRATASAAVPQIRFEPLTSSFIFD